MNIPDDWIKRLDYYIKNVDNAFDWNSKKIDIKQRTAIAGLLGYLESLKLIK